MEVSSEERSMCARSLQFPIVVTANYDLLGLDTDDPNLLARISAPPFMSTLVSFVVLHLPLLTGYKALKLQT